MDSQTILNISEDFPLRIHHLKQRLQKEHGLSWGQYLILCTVRKIDKERHFVTTQEVEEELGMNRCWIYKCVRVLVEEGLLLIDTTDKHSNPIDLSPFYDLVDEYGLNLIVGGGRHPAYNSVRDELLGTVPNQKGVYAFVDKNKTIVYVWRSSDRLNERLHKEHFRRYPSLFLINMYDWAEIENRILTQFNPRTATKYANEHKKIYAVKKVLNI